MITIAYTMFASLCYSVEHRELRLIIIMMVNGHFQQYFSYIVAISFIGGANRRTGRKPPTCRKSL